MSSFMQLASGGTSVEFTWDNDRWRHEIRTADGGGWSSVEGADDSADHRWPESPVLTEISLEEVAGKPVLLGVGLAGRSHFSLCVTVHPDAEDTLLFEAACRINSPAERLGSTYCGKDGHAVRIEPQTPPSAPPATVCWNYTVGPNGLRALTRDAGG
jgi:hypothetical protein